MSLPFDVLRLQSLVGSLPVSMVAADLDGRVLAWNREAETMYGWTSAEAVGQRLGELIVPIDTRTPVGVVRQQVRSGQTWEGEYMVRRRDGRELRLHCINSPLLDESGAVTGILGLAVDVTREREVGIAVLEAVLDNCPTSVTVVGADDRIVLTVGAARNHETAKSAYVGRRVSELIPGVSFAAMLSRVRLGETARQLVQFGDRSYDTTTVVLPEAVAGPGGVAFIATDITEHAAERRRFQALVETVEDVTSIFDLDGSYRYVSPAVERLSGYTPEEMMDMHGFELVHHADRAATSAAFEAVRVQPDAVVTQVFRMRHRDGSWRDVEQTIVNRSLDPSIGGLVAIARDITARVRTERRLRAISRMHAVLSETGTAILRSSTPMQLLEQTCHILVHVGHFAAAAFTTTASPAGEVTMLSHCAAAAQEPAAPRMLAAMVDAVQVSASAGQRQSPVALFALERRHGADGILAICSAPDGEAMTEDETQQVVRLARNVAFALDALTIDAMRSEALRVSERRAQQQSIISALGHLACGTAGTAETIDAAVAALAPFGLHEVALFEATAEDTELVVRAAVGERGRVSRGDVIARSSAPLTSGVLTSGEPATVDDFSADPRFNHLAGKPFVAVGSAVAVPLRVNGVTIAALTVHSFTPGDFDQHDVRFFESLANVLSGSIARGRYAVHAGAVSAN